MVTDGATVVVVAVDLVGHMKTADPRTAGVVRANVAIITGEGLGTWVAGTSAAGVPQGTEVTVVARCDVQLVGAPFVGRTAICCARVGVVAVDRHPTQTDASSAAFTNGAGIPVVACPRLVGRHQTTAAGGRCAGWGQAFGTKTLGHRTLHHRIRVDLAGLRELSRVAEENSVAEIAVLKCPTIGGFLAVTGKGGPHAFPLLAGVIKGARVAIVTRCRVEGIETPGGRVAGIVGTKIVVVALDNRTFARSFLAIVTFATRITIVAHDAGHGHELTTIDTAAIIVGTTVAVVTNEIVNLAIAVVVETVAALFSGEDGVARGEPRRATDASPRATPPLVS